MPESASEAGLGAYPGHHHCGVFGQYAGKGGIASRHRSGPGTAGAQVLHLDGRAAYAPVPAPAGSDALEDAGSRWARRESRVTGLPWMLTWKWQPESPAAITAASIVAARIRPIIAGASLIDPHGQRRHPLAGLCHDVLAARYPGTEADTGTAKSPNVISTVPRSGGIDATAGSV
jgi:hypothetical protein